MPPEIGRISMRTTLTVRASLRPSETLLVAGGWQAPRPSPNPSAKPIVRATPAMPHFVVVITPVSWRPGGRFCCFVIPSAAERLIGLHRAPQRLHPLRGELGAIGAPGLLGGEHGGDVVDAQAEAPAAGVVSAPGPGLAVRQHL